MYIATPTISVTSHHTYCSLNLNTCNSVAIIPMLTVKASSHATFPPTFTKILCYITAAPITKTTLSTF